MKKIKHFLWILLFIVVLENSLLWSQPRTATLTWNAVTTNIAGTPITGVTYNVYRGTKADGTDLLLLNPQPLSAPTFTDTTITVTAVYYYAATALWQGVESERSALVRFSKMETTPQAPTGLVIH